MNEKEMLDNTKGDQTNSIVSESTKIKKKKSSNPIALILPVIIIVICAVSLYLKFYPMINDSIEYTAKIQTIKEEQKIVSSQYNSNDYENNLYYCQLNDVEKTVYRSLYNSSLKHLNTVFVDIEEPVTDYEFTRAVQAFISEFPQYYWWRESYLLSDYNLYEFVKTNTSEIETYLKQIEENGNEIINSCKTDDEYETLRNLYMFFVENVVYDEDAEFNQDVRSSIIYKKSVCAGISEGFAYLAQKLGYKCVYVSGTRGGEKHAWNLIELNDNWYWLDATLDVETKDTIDYLMYLAPDEMFLKDKTFSNKFTFPSCDNYDLYFNKDVKLIFENERIFDELNTVVSTMLKNKTTGKRTICIFKSPYKYYEMKDFIQNPNKIDEYGMIQSTSKKYFDDYYLFIIN